MRVRDGDGGDPAERAHRRNRRGIEQADAIPQHIPRRCLHEECALPDGETRVRADAGQVRGDGFDDIVGVRLQGDQRRPLLPVVPTYCRSSSQIGHCSGGASVAANCTPHVLQMKCSLIKDHPPSVMAKSVLSIL